FSKNLYIASTALEQNGVSDPQSDQQTVTQLIQKEASKIHPDSFTQKDIVIGTSDAQPALQKYGNSVAALFKGLITQETLTTYRTSIGTYTNSKNDIDLAPLVQSSVMDSNILEKLLALSVPPSLVPLHLQMLNNVGTFVNTVHDLSVASEDPVRATLA